MLCAQSKLKVCCIPLLNIHVLNNNIIRVPNTHSHYTTYIATIARSHYNSHAHNVTLTHVFNGTMHFEALIAQMRSSL